MGKRREVWKGHLTVSDVLDMTNWRSLVKYTRDAAFLHRSRCHFHQTLQVSSVNMLESEDVGCRYLSGRFFLMLGSTYGHYLYKSV